jgi:hypothetical protein
MPQQLIYTSAPRGLVAGRSGYCTVARSAAMREGLMLRLEQLSYYQHLSLSGGRERPIFAYRVVDIRGTRFHVLSRIQDAGLDFSGRTNFLAQHLAFTPEEIGQLACPALLLGRWTGWFGNWAGEPRLLDREDWSGLRALSDVSSLPATAWAGLTGDAANGYALLEARAGSCFQADKVPDEQLLRLLAESSELSETRDNRGTNRGAYWQYTFTTLLQEQDNPADFRWRFVHAGTPAFAKVGAANCPPLSSLRAAHCTEQERALAAQGRKPPTQVIVLAKQQSVLEGSVAKFEAESDGLPRPSFQWFEVAQGKPVKLEGKTARTLEIVAQGRARRYLVRATNSSGSRDSAVVELTVGSLLRMQRPVTARGDDEVPSVVPRSQESTIEKQRNRLLADQAEQAWRRKKSTRTLIIVSASTVALIGGLLAWFHWNGTPGPEPAGGETNQPPIVKPVGLTNPVPTQTVSNREVFSSSSAPAGAASQPQTNLQPAEVAATNATRSTNSSASVVSEVKTDSAVDRKAAEWQFADVGSPRTAGSGQCKNDVFTIHGSGLLYKQSSDSFGMMWKRVAGDGEFVAKANGLWPLTKDPQYGIMLRASASPDAPYVFVGGNEQFSCCASRAKPGAPAQQKDVQGIAEDLKLVRSGNTFTFYCGFKGGVWKQLGSVVVPMQREVLAAVVVCSGPTDQPALGSFRDVRWNAATATDER